MRLDALVVLWSFGSSGVLACRDDDPRAVSEQDTRLDADTLGDEVDATPDAPDADDGDDGDAEADTDEGDGLTVVEIDVPVRCPQLTPERVEVGEGGRATFVVEGGTGIELDPGGLVAWREGVTVVARAPYAAGEHVLRISADGCAAVEARLVVRPIKVTSVTWEPGDTTAPEAREHPLFFVDSDRPDTLVVGSGYGFVPAQLTPLWDLWSYDLAGEGGWTRLEATRKEAYQLGLAGRAAPWGEGDGFVVQGGEGPADIASGLVVHGASWSTFDLADAAPGLAGPRNYLQGFVRVTEGSYLSTLGLTLTGDGGFAFDRDTWHFAPDVGWRRLELLDGVRPSARYGFAFAWDEATWRLVVVSGARLPTSAADPVNAAPDTWTLQLDGDLAAPTGALWQELDVAGTPRLRNGCWAYDPEGRRLLVFGGTADAATALPGMHVLELDPGHERWVDLSARAELPPPRASCAGAWDAARGRFVLGFGNDAAAIRRDLWLIAL